MSRIVRDIVVFSPDGLTLNELVSFVGRFKPLIGRVKIHSRFPQRGHEVVQMMHDLGVSWVCVDAKICESPPIAAQLVADTSASGASAVTVLATGGIRMMEASIDAAAQFGKAKIYAVTVPSGKSAEKAALSLALDAQAAGVTSLVCSALELKLLRSQESMAGMEFRVPGTRFSGSAPGSQRRYTTPIGALRAGATTLVLASELFNSKDPAKLLADFQIELDQLG